jgi:hypothetical protein
MAETALLLQPSSIFLSILWHDHASRYIDKITGTNLEIDERAEYWVSRHLKMVVFPEKHALLNDANSRSADTRISYHPQSGCMIFSLVATKNLAEADLNC